MGFFLSSDSFNFLLQKQLESQVVVVVVASLRFAWPLMFCLEVQTRLSGLTRTSINKIMFALLCFPPLPFYVKEKYIRDLSRNAASSSSAL